jgi:membrane dipeptidase
MTDIDAIVLHRDAIVFDGLIVANWSPDILAEMRRGGLSGANCTCCVWENFADTMRNIAQWNGFFRDHGNLVVKARTVGDIRAAKSADKTAIVLGFQNTSAFEDRIGNVQHFKDVGVGIVQLAYNTQNFVGAGCYESNDSGLSDFGHDVLAEMNRVGMLCDLSHVGARTSRDAITASTKPVAYTHCLPSGLKAHPRNKPDEDLKFIADHGGFIGVTMFPPFLPRGPKSTVDDYVAAMDYVIDIAGEDSVGIGTDFTQDHAPSFFEWITHDKGDGRKLTDFGKITNPEGIRTISEFPNLTAAMVRAGWNEAKIRKVLGENWLGLLGEVWGA